MIYCIERNYVPEDSSAYLDLKPLVFSKPHDMLLPEGSAFTFTEFEQQRLFCQCELVLFICRDGKNIPATAADAYYDSISAGISFTGIDIDKELNGIEISWDEAKSWKFSNITGNRMPAANYKKLPGIHFCLYKNREMAQSGQSEWMTSDFGTIISDLSEQYELKKGDIIFTGAPGGMLELDKDDVLEIFLEDDSMGEYTIS